MDSSYNDGFKAGVLNGREQVLENMREIAATIDVCRASSNYIEKQLHIGHSTMYDIYEYKSNLLDTLLNKIDGMMVDD